MEVWSASKLQETITRLKDKGRIGDEQCVMYVLNPLVTSLGYNVFDIDEVDTDMVMGKMGITVQDGLKILVGLSVNFPRYGKEDEKIYLHVDVMDLKLTLYMKALGKWESVGEVYLNKPDEQRMYPYIMKNIAKSTLKQVYAEKGERLFTEGVLRNNLDEGELSNRFVRSVIREELNNPSDNFIRLIAEGLVRKYSTENVSGLVTKLVPLKDTGLIDIVKNVLNYEESDMEDVTSNFGENMGEKEDTLQFKDHFKTLVGVDMGSGLSNTGVGKDETTKDTPYKEEPIQEEDNSPKQTEQDTGVFLEKGKSDVTYVETVKGNKDDGVFIEKTETVPETEEYGGLGLELVEQKPRVRQINPLRDKQERQEKKAEDVETNTAGLGSGEDLMKLLED